ncbi:MAG: hypothetical protein C4K60_04525 [Ideonella sp. MAG2]|nr:MAG: hypothetical protein C4K60_04525 [Ideonella sp. MAG2]
MSTPDIPTIIDRGDAVCVIGAGPGGLSIARALKAQGLSYDQFERHSNVGGLWDMSNPGSPIYESAHFISSRELSGFIGFPMPKDYPDYPSNQQILAYVHAFADAFGLRENIRFNTAVQALRKDEDQRWLVTLSDGQVRRYAAVVCATGVNWDPNLPSYPGQFSGEARHAVTYKSGDELAGKRVMVVGGGNSGADIACDAAMRGRKAFISLRRGYHFVPKHVMGVPADVFGETGPHLPMWLARPIFGVLLRLLVGKPQRWGWPEPDHRLFESHPLLNSQLLHHLQHGNIQVKPDIAHFDGPAVVFTDGTREELDVVLFATGYKWSCPYAADYFEWRGGRPQLYLSMFSREHRNLFGIGYLETNSSAYKLFDTQAYMIACYLKAQVSQPATAAQFDQLIQHDRPDLSGGLKFIPSQRHEVYLEAHTLKKYLKKLRAKMGWGEPSEHTYRHCRVATAQGVPVSSPA